MRQHRYYQIARFWEIRMPLIVIVVIILSVAYGLCRYPSTTGESHLHYEGR